jgi:5,10-methylenetetrahydrofolate reductase
MSFLVEYHKRFILDVEDREEAEDVISSYAVPQVKETVDEDDFHIVQEID